MYGGEKNKSRGGDGNETPAPNVNTFYLCCLPTCNGPRVLSLLDRNEDIRCGFCAKWGKRYRSEYTGASTPPSANANVPSGNTKPSTTNDGSDSNNGTSTGDIENTGGVGYGNGNSIGTGDFARLRAAGLL